MAAAAAAAIFVVLLFTIHLQMNLWAHISQMHSNSQSHRHISVLYVCLRVNDGLPMLDYIVCTRINLPFGVFVDLALYNIGIKCTSK